MRPNHRSDTPEDVGDLETLRDVEGYTVRIAFAPVQTFIFHFLYFSFQRLLDTLRGAILSPPPFSSNTISFLLQVPIDSFATFWHCLARILALACLLRLYKLRYQKKVIPFSSHLCPADISRSMHRRKPIVIALGLHKDTQYLMRL